MNNCLYQANGELTCHRPSDAIPLHNYAVIETNDQIENFKNYPLPPNYRCTNNGQCQSYTGYHWCRNNKCTK